MMVYQQQRSLTNSGASTSDWIGQAKGVIYGFDLAAWAGLSSPTEGVGNSKHAKARFSLSLEPSEPGEATTQLAS